MWKITKVDKWYRVKLPKEVIDQLGILPDDIVAVTVKDRYIIIAKPKIEVPEEVTTKVTKDIATSKQVDLIFQLAKEVAEMEGKDTHEILDMIQKELGIDVMSKELGKDDADKVIKFLKEWKK